VVNQKKGHCAKCHAILKEFHTHHFNEGRKWFVIADDDTIFRSVCTSTYTAVYCTDDTIFSIPTLLHILSTLDPEQEVYLGERYAYAHTNGREDGASWEGTIIHYRHSLHSAPMSVLLCTNVRPSLHQCRPSAAPMSVLLCTNGRPSLHQCPSFSCTNVRPSLHQCPSFSAPMSVLLCTNGRPSAAPMSVLLLQVGRGGTITSPWGGVWPCRTRWVLTHYTPYTTPYTTHHTPFSLWQCRTSTWRS
jgi:hypothetical protein